MQKDIAALSEEIFKKKLELHQLRREMGAMPVENYRFQNLDGQWVTLDSLFNENGDLIVVHNMGKSCAYCTLWADGFIGFAPHLLSQTAFVLVTPDPPEVAREFAKSRGWNFPIVCDIDEEFSKAVGFLIPEKGWWPGASGFKLRDGKITRVAFDYFGPFDDYCSPFHLFELLEGGRKDWCPDLS